MKIRIMKLVVSSVILLPLLLAHSFQANAELTNIGSPKAGIDVKYPDNLNDTWKTPISNGISAWNGTATKVTIGYLSSSTNSITAAQYSDTWYGLNTQWKSPYKYTIQLNARTIARDATNFSNFVKGTTVHEFGHCFFLKDNPNTTLASIMKYTNNFNTVTTPQQYDINDVNSVY
ncbi:hypothetical protein [Paenibacillus lutimineralis]|uniref:Peptidase M10 metallopeptidase domain-containing protein n=1 Tax=Paenibacillus lutimineralis TaxID=2707005 RepID=A0A3S9V023_9BACL|nr:hypothetical protein [Paenibacillus lutimineralis]AZS15913.1 hypothetical protein EI981_16700 [Paenibacillus lutimineralis]